MPVNPTVVAAAVSDIRKLGRQLGGILTLADQLEEVASLEQAAKEAYARVAKAREDEQAATKALSQVKAAMADAESAALGIVGNAKAEFDRIVGKAQAEAHDILDKAEADAALMSGTMKADYSLAESALESMRKETQELEGKAAALRAELANLKAERDAILAKFGGAK